MVNAPIATASSACQTAESIDDLCNTLLRGLEKIPQLVIVSYSSICDISLITGRLPANFPDSAVMGGSTCRGSMTSEGLIAFGDANVSLWGLCDDEGDFGVGFSDYSHSVHQAAILALEQAIVRAGREGELPDLVWIHSSPGNEEEVVATIDALLGHDVLIVGGSIADENLEGNWSCFAQSESTGNGVALGVFYSSYEISMSFQSGYQPTKHSGVATKCEGRTVYEIDNQPAATLYNQWANDLHDLEREQLPINVLGSSTLSPVGVAVGDVSGIPYYNLAHPETYTQERALTFFCEIPQGETLTLMDGTLDNIISRPGRVANEAINNACEPTGEVIGGLVVFCGGCLLAIEPRVREITDHLNQSMNQQPYMGCFTFGEQGRFSNGENRHGNLMISVTVFRK